MGISIYTIRNSALRPSSILLPVAHPSKADQKTSKLGHFKQKLLKDKAAVNQQAENITEFKQSIQAQPIV